MTDRPILFSAPMILALLDGRKTQTRRVMPPPHGLFKYTPGRGMTPFFTKWKPGDRLWVREAWRTSRHYDDLRPSEMGGEEPVKFLADGKVQTLAGRADDFDGRKRPGMFMPRWASRLTLTVTDVRVQRVQDISHHDAKSEGVLPNGKGATPIDQFRTLWDSLSAKRGYGWEANPWVAATTFTVRCCNIDQMGTIND